MSACYSLYSGLPTYYGNRDRRPALEAYSRKGRGGPAPFLLRWSDTVSDAGHSLRWVHGQPGARTPAWVRHILQCEPPHQPDRCLRGELPAVCVRQAREGPQSLHHVARRGLVSRGRGLDRGRNGVSHRGGLASGADPRLVLRDAARAEGALSAGASEGLHHGGGGVPGPARQDFRPRCTGTLARRRHGFAAGRRFSATACAASSATTKSPARSGWKPPASRTSWGYTPTAPCSTDISRMKRTAPIIW